MKKMFKDIRNGDLDSVRTATAKNSAVVNEIFDGKAPKKDIGQSPLQVAVKCGEFEIIDFLLKNGADADFMEDLAQVVPGSVCMSVLHDAIIGAFASICYEKYEDAERYAEVVKALLEQGADPNRQTSVGILPVGTAVYRAEYVLCGPYPEKALEAAKKQLFKILDLLLEYGADMGQWLEQDFCGESSRTRYVDDFVPKEDTYVETRHHGRNFKTLIKGDIDGQKNIRSAMQEYFAYW